MHNQHLGKLHKAVHRHKLHREAMQAEAARLQAERDTNAALNALSGQNLSLSVNTGTSAGVPDTGGNTGHGN